MSKLIRKCTTLFIAVLVLFSLSATCFAEMSEEDFHELFVYAAQTDGAYTEGILDPLAQAFQEDMHTFISVLSAEEPLVQSRIIGQLAFNPNFTYDGLLAKVEELTAQSGWSTNEYYLLRHLRGEILIAKDEYAKHQIPVKEPLEPIWYVTGALFLLLCLETGYIVYKKAKK